MQVSPTYLNKPIILVSIVISNPDTTSLTPLEFLNGVDTMYCS